MDMYSSMDVVMPNAIDSSQRFPYKASKLAFKISTTSSAVLQWHWLMADMTHSVNASDY